MKKIFYCGVCAGLLMPVIGFESFEYPSPAALRQVWREYDAGNPAPEFTGTGTMGLHIRTGKSYSLLYRVLPTAPADVKGYEVEAAGVSVNPAGAVLTAQLRGAKDGPVLASASTPLDRDGAVKLSLAAPKSAEYPAPCILLMVTQPETGKTVNCWVKKIGMMRPERTVTGDDFSGYSDLAALLKQWREFDSGNPRPRDIKLSDGKMLINCAGLGYGLIYRDFAVEPGLKLSGIRIDFRGVAGSGRLEFIIRSSRDGANLSAQNVTLDGRAQNVTLRGDALAGHKSLTLLIFFHNTTGKMAVDLEKVSFIGK